MRRLTLFALILFISPPLFADVGPTDVSQPTQDVTAADVVVADTTVSDTTPSQSAEIDAPEVPKDVGEITGGLVSAIAAHNWGLVVGFGLMLLVFFIRVFWKSFPKKAVPWVALASGLVVSVAVELVGGGVWWKAVLNGLMIGLTAPGFWQILKPVLNKYVKE